MTNNRISPARQYEAKRNPNHPKICAHCQLVWREYSPARDPHCHCFDYEYEDERREMERIESRKRYMEDANERSKAKQRIAALEAENARLQARVERLAYERVKTGHRRDAVFCRHCGYGYVEPDEPQHEPGCIVTEGE